MKTYLQSANKSTFETTELKLAALIYASVEGCAVEVYSDGNSIKKMIQLIFSAQNQLEVDQLVADFINRQAVCNISVYNRCLNVIRDKIKVL